MGKNLAHINSAHYSSTTKVTLTYLQGRKEKSKCGYVVRKNLDFDKAEILLYEPLEKMPPFSRKTLVFVSPPGKNLWIKHRGLKLDGAIGQGEICNSLKSEKFSKSFLSHIGKNKIKF